MMDCSSKMFKRLLEVCEDVPRCAEMIVVVQKGSGGLFRLHLEVYNRYEKCC